MLLLDEVKLRDYVNVSYVILNKKFEECAANKLHVFRMFKVN